MKMRELSVVELDLIVGGYDQGGGSFDESVYESSAIAEADGSYSLVVSQAEYNAQSTSASNDGWTFGGTVTHGPNGTTVSVTASKSC
jgi:hypothetical protein